MVEGGGPGGRGCYAILWRKIRPQNVLVTFDMCRSYDATMSLHLLSVARVMFSTVPRGFQGTLNISVGTAGCNISHWAQSATASSPIF